MYTSMISETMENMEQMDMIVLPTALAMLAFLLGSCRLLVIPILCLLVTASAAFAAVDGVTHVMDIMTAGDSCVACWGTRCRTVCSPVSMFLHFLGYVEASGTKI